MALALHIQEPLTLSNQETESEEDLTALDSKGYSQAVVFATDWTAETILSQLKKGNISLDPGYQRRDAWRSERKSRFIESLLLGLPIPQLVLAESKERRGSYIVIDGKQRLLTLSQFAGNPKDPHSPLRLSGLTARRDLNGKTLQDIEHDPSLQGDVSSFQNQPIRTVVLRNWPNEDFLYLVFHRLNTGSMQLSPQELRQALHPGEFVSFSVDRSAASRGLQKFLQIKEPDFRMRDVELLVRYFAFKNFIGYYTGNLKEFMDHTCLSLNIEWAAHRDLLMAQADDMDEAIEATFGIFGDENAFRKWDGERFQPRRNRAVFDIMLFYFSEKEYRLLGLEQKENVVREFKRLCSVTEFVRSLETTTKSLTATQFRLTEWGKALATAIGAPIPTPIVGAQG